MHNLLIEVIISCMLLQVEDILEIDENIKELVTASQEHQSSTDAYDTNFENSIVGNQFADVLPPGMSSQIRSFDDLNGVKRYTKRNRKATEKARQDQIREQKCQNDGINMDSNIASKVIEEQSLDYKHGASNLKKSNRRSKTVLFVTSTDSTPQSAGMVSNMLGVQSNGEGKMAKNSYTSASKEGNEMRCPWKIAGKSQVIRAGKQELDDVHDPPEDLSSEQNQCNEFAGSASFTLSLQTYNNGKAANTGKRKSSLSRNSMSCSKEQKSAKKSKVSPDYISRTKKDEDIQLNKSIKQGTDVRALNDNSKEKHCHLTDKPVLKKCVSHVKKYQCAFCLSSEESEVKLFA